MRMSYDQIGQMAKGDVTFVLNKIDLYILTISTDGTSENILNVRVFKYCDTPIKMG